MKTPSLWKPTVLAAASLSLFAMGTWLYVQQGKWTGSRHLANAKRANIVQLDGILSITTAVNHSSKPTESLDVSMLNFSSGTLGLSNGIAVRFSLGGCGDGINACLTITSDEQIPELKNWFSMAFEKGIIEHREIGLDLKKKPLIFHEALPRSWEIAAYGDTPLYIYKLQSDQLE